MCRAPGPNLINFFPLWETRSYKFKCEEQSTRDPFPTFEDGDPWCSIKVDWSVWRWLVSLKPRVNTLSLCFKLRGSYFSSDEIGCNISFLLNVQNSCSFKTHYLQSSISAELEDVRIAPANNATKINIAHAPPDNAKEMNIATAFQVSENPSNVSRPNAAATNAMDMMNIAAASLPMPQNPTNEGNETSSCIEGNEKKLIMGTGHLSRPSGQHVVCCPWKPEMTLPRDAEMLFRDDRFIAYRLVKP